MLHVTQDIMEVRRWAQAHGARPCRDEATGRIGLAHPGDPCAFEVGWDEFEPAFCTTHSVFVYEDGPGARRFFVGGAEEAHAYVASHAAPDAHA